MPDSGAGIFCRREIGIRSALTADPRRILTGICARLRAGLDTASQGETLGGNRAIILPATLAVCLRILY